jgi:hypothetical protein
LQADEAARTARVPFTQTADRPTTSAALAGTVAKKAEKDYAKVKNLWNKVAGGKPITQGDIVSELDNFFAMKKISPNKQRRLRESFSGTFKAINELEGDVDLDDISDIISILSSESKQISAGTRTGAGLQHVDDIKEALYKSLSRSRKGADKERLAAAKAYRDYMETYGKRSTLGKAMTAEEDIMAEKLIKPNPAGASALRKSLSVTGANKEAADVLRARFREEVMDADGNIKSLNAVNNFEKKYREHLKIPGMEQLRDEVNATARTTGSLDDATKALEEAMKASEQGMKAVDESMLGKLAATGPTEAEITAKVRKLMVPKTAKDVGANLRALVDSVGDNKEAREHIRRAIADEFYNSVTTKTGKLTQESLNLFKQRKPMYQQSGVFTKKELDNIEKGMVEGQKLFLTTNKARLAALKPEERRVTEAVAALAGAKVGAAAFGSPLIGAALGRKFAIDKLRELGSDKVRKLAFELSVNPERYVEYANKLNAPNVSARETAKLLSDLFDEGLKNALASGAKTEILDEEQ